MFTQEEKMIIAQDYFKLQTLTDSYCEFQSQNHDWWIILEVEVYQSKKQLSMNLPKKHIYKLFHRHSEDSGYHEHGEYAEVLDSVLEVINHDDYRLKNRCPTHFEELLEWYRVQRLLQTV